MSDNALERASIQIRVVKSGRRNSQLQFALLGPSNEPLLLSEPFESANPPRREKAETAVLDGLLQNIRDQGWQIIDRPSGSDEWWALRFARGNPESIQREKEWAGLVTPVSPTANQSAPLPPQREVVFVEKKRGCFGGCLSGVGAIVVGIIGLIVVIAVIAVVATNSSGDDNDGPSVNDQGTPQADKVGSGENPAPIGTAVTADGLEITVHSAGLSDTAGVLAGAEPGVMYLTLDVSIRNVSDDKKSYNTLYWSGRDPVNGYNFDDDVFAGDSVNPLSSGDIQPGDVVRGEVVIKVRDDSQTVRIKYDTSPIGGANLYWLFESS